jgi:hypothetical protein
MHGIGHFKIAELIVEQRILLLIKVLCEIVMCNYFMFTSYNVITNILSLMKASRFIHLMTKLYLSDLKPQSVPRSKHCLGYKDL